MIPLYYQKLVQPCRGGDDEPRARQGTVNEVRPPFSDQLQGYDTLSANPIMRFFYVQLEKKL